MKRTFNMTLEEIVAQDGVPRREIWLAPDAGGQESGDGTPSRPIRVSTPQEFDQVFIKRHTGVAGQSPTVYRLMPGVYLTQGCWAHPYYATLHRSDALIGTTDVEILLEDPVRETNGKARPDVHVLSAGSPYTSGAKCRIENLTIEGFEEEVDPDDLFVTSGLRCYGTNCIVRNVSVMGLRGSYDPIQTPSGKIPLEAFGISFQDGSQCRVTDCLVNANAVRNQYASAFSAGPGEDDGTVFDGCVAIGFDQHAAFTVYSKTVLRNCRASGYAYGIYNDSGTVEGVNVDGGSFECNRVGLGLVAVYPGGYKRSISVDRARFHFPRHEAPPVGIELILKPNTPAAEFGNIHATRCEFTSDARFTLVSTDAPARLLRLVRVSDSIIPLDTRLNVPDGHTMRFTGLISPEGTPYLDTKPTGLVTTFGK